MSNLTITKDNYLEYLRTWKDSPESFIKALRRLCNVAPEFTQEPRMKIFKDGLFYKSHYSYGEFTAHLRFTFFCFNEEKLCDYEILIFDLKSFGIRVASLKQIKNRCGEAPPWYDPEGKLSDETVELIDYYMRTRVKLERMK